MRIVGNEIEHTDAVQSVAAKSLEGSYAWVVPHKNIFLFPRNTVVRDVTAVFPRFKSVDVRAESLNGIVVTVAERKPAYLWCTSDTVCYYVDDSGVAFSGAPVFSGNLFFEFRDTATTTDATGATTTAVQLGQPVMDSTLWKKVVATKQQVADLFDGRFAEVGDLVRFWIEPSGVWSVEVKSKNDQNKPWKLIFNEKDVNDQLMNSIVTTLQYLLEQNARKGVHPQLEYIDLRFGNKVFYKYSDAP